MEESFFATQGHFDLVVHRHDFGRRDDRQPLALRRGCAAFRQPCFDLVGETGQEQAHVGLTVAKRQRGRNCHGKAEIATHAIDRDSDHSHGHRKACFRPL